MPTTTVRDSVADRIRRFAYEAIVRPKLTSGAMEVAVRAGDLHSALKLHNQMPNVCSSIESRKFLDTFGLELVRREGPHRGANTVYFFRLRGELAPATAPLHRTSLGIWVAQLERAASPVKVPRTSGTVYWVSCVKEKSPSRTSARELYASAWFKKARTYVESTGAPWYILSAKYGLVAPDAIIEPYELTLNALRVKERRLWAERVIEQIKMTECLPAKVVILAGARYREFLEPYLRSAGVEVEVPMERLTRGKQLRWLSRTAQPIRRSRIDDLRRFYELLERLERRLGGKRVLGECDGRMPWVRRGVYFFFEPGELRSDSGKGLRVVRVGTHALKAGSTSTLWGRLSQHRGNAGDRGGNHRGSIFRLLVGSAIKSRDRRDDPKSWGIKPAATAVRDLYDNDLNLLKRSEALLERTVSELIGEMPFLYLPVDDDPGPNSLRGHIERNAIGLLSNFQGERLDPPSPEWLGRNSSRELVRDSGLWNNHHVDQGYDPSFLDDLERLIAGERSGP